MLELPLNKHCLLFRAQLTHYYRSLTLTSLSALAATGLSLTAAATLAKILGRRRAQLALVKGLALVRTKRGFLGFLVGCKS